MSVFHTNRHIYSTFSTEYDQTAHIETEIRSPCNNLPFLYTFLHQIIFTLDLIAIMDLQIRRHF